MAYLASVQCLILFVAHNGDPSFLKKMLDHAELGYTPWEQRLAKVPLITVWAQTLKLYAH